jgi:NADPH-dependent ferric siderophore reductase
LPHILVAGSFDELPAIEALLFLLPETTYGQVLVETPVDLDLQVLARPARVTVTRLARDQDAEPGALLADAVHAWLAEWMPDEADASRMFTLWVGGTARGRVDPAGAQLETL